MTVRFGHRLQGALAEARLRTATGKGLEAALKLLAETSRARAPRDTGQLQKTCLVRKSAGGSRGAVAYLAPYAERQHEDEGLRHPGGGQAKYLEAVVRDEAVRTEMRRRLAQAYGEVLK